MASAAPAVGERVLHDGFAATVRYVGPRPSLPPQLVLGLEFDEAERGKHDGLLDDQQLFVSSRKGAAIFVRPSHVKLQRARTLGEAIQHRYLDAGGPAGSLPSSLALDALAISSASLAPVPPSRLADVVRLDLSRNLLDTLDSVSRIASALPNLYTLLLDCNRFCDPAGPVTAACPTGIRHLAASRTKLAWSYVAHAELFAKLETLVFGWNSLEHLLSPPTQPLRSINLEGNVLRDWPDIVSSLGHLPRLEHLVLAHNRLALLMESDGASDTFPSLVSLSLRDNLLDDMQALDVLRRQTPHLAELGLSGNPCVAALTPADMRAQVLARLPALRMLDRSEITDAERNAARKATQSPRELVRVASPVGPVALASRLVDLRIVYDGHSSCIRVLPSTPLRHVRLRVAKTLNLPSDGFSMRSDPGESEDEWDERRTLAEVVGITAGDGIAIRTR